MFVRKLCLLMIAGWSSVASAGMPEAFESLRAGRYPEALAEFRKVAATGDPAATFNVGVMTMRGVGTERDVQAGLRAMSDAAYGGFELAQRELYGLFSKPNDQVDPDPAEALRWATLLAERSTEFQLVVARSHLDGVGTSKDPAKAYPWLRRAAGARHPKAIGELGHFFAAGLQPVRKSPPLARALYVLAAKSNAPEFEAFAEAIANGLKPVDLQRSDAEVRRLLDATDLMAAIDRAAVPAATAKPSPTNKKAGPTKKTTGK